jgi:hypothetical protein
MFGDSVWDEEERLRRAEEGREPFDPAEGGSDTDTDDIMAIGGLDERLRRRQAISDLLREVGGC